MTNRTANTDRWGAAYPRGQGRAKVREMHARGLTPTEIARLLNITRQGVNYHLKRIEREQAS